MTDPLPQPGRGALATELAEVAASFAGFAEAMHGVNDEALITAFRDLLAVAPPIIASHQQRIGPTLADDMATLNSLVARYPIPREDPDLGRTERLKALRAARGNLVADIESLLVAAKALGLVPSRPEIALPPATVVERAGLEWMLSGIVRRLGDVEQGLKRVAAEADPEAQPSVRQIGLVNLYVGSMEVELALAKLEASAKKLIDLSGLGRAIEAIGTLTTDFIATTRGMVRTIGTGLRDAARAMAPSVGKLVSGMKAISLRLGRRSATSAANPPQLTAPQTTAEPQTPPSLPTDPDPPDAAGFWARITAGNQHVTRGSLAAAHAEYLAAEAIAERLLVPEPDAPQWARLVGVSQYWLGDLARASGDLGEARRRFTAYFDIAERLAASDPANSLWQRDLAVSHQQLGDLARASGDLAEARRHFSTDLDIAERLAASDPAKSQWQRDLSVSLNKLGDLARASGDLAEARRRFTASLDIRERLAASDPANSEWQRDLSISHNKLGDLARASGDLAEARRRFTAGLDIAERLAASDPDNSEWQRDLSVSHEKLGDLARASGDLAEARRRFTARHDIAERLAASDPANSEWQRDLCVSLTRLGELAADEGNIANAINHFRASLPIIEALTAQSPDMLEWQDDLAYARRRLTELEAKAGG